MLPVTMTALSTNDVCGISAVATVPADVPLGSAVTVLPATVAGTLLTDRGGLHLPVSLCVSDVLGLVPPFELAGVGCDYQTPCISADSRVYFANGAVLSSFDDTGKALMQWDLPFSDACAVAVDDRTGMVIVRRDPHVFAFNISSGRKPTLLWRRDCGKIGRGGLAIVPSHEIAVFADYYGNALVFFKKFESCTHDWRPRLRFIPTANTFNISLYF